MFVFNHVYYVTAAAGGHFIYPECVASPDQTYYAIVIRAS